MDYTDRIKVDDSSTLVDGVSVQNLNLIFEFPNESDLGNCYVNTRWYLLIKF